MKTSRLLFLGVCLTSCISYYGHAQADDRITPPRLAVKWSPFHLIYFYPSAQFSIEHKLTKDFTMVYDLGWIINYNENDSEDYSNRRGFRGLAELRYYLPFTTKVPLYFAGEYYYHRIQFDRSSVLGYECATGECNYYEYITYKVQTHQQGVGLKFGILLFPAWNKNRSFFIDIQGGLAYRFIRYEDKGIPNVPNSSFFDNDNDNLFTPNEEDHSAPRPVIGIRLGYRIR